MSGAGPRSTPISIDEVELAAGFGPVALRSPILAASGCFAYGQQFDAFMDLRQLGGLSTKGISPLPRHGNPLPRIYETASGMLNSIGLENVGCAAFLAEKLPFLAELGVSVWVNFFGTDFETYVECARTLSEGSRRAHGDGGIDVLEMNISCPNIKKGGIEFGTVPEVAHRLTKACVEVSEIPIVVKLTPNVSDVVAMADAVKQAGAAGVSLINTITGMAVDVRARRSRIATTYGGLSGPAIKPVALRMVHQVAQALPGFPICGMGGIISGEDALEFLMAGAHCVQLGTINFSEPGAALRVTDELRGLMAELGIRKIADAVSTLEPYPVEPPHAESRPATEPEPKPKPEPKPEPR
ncbi:Dihydroorotate dehydrogenase B, catalytic subunit [Enhygromyxa salina]|uniref:Dihydroorotate dehydrogenase n=1 Tax=Enhygromyxa salina TaxID=215803 RepID=A0A2S9YG89_9BACT|nr:dihydroorotate dehydrogenase [Enhygromyxa salina]PRQ04036.1 Dihydroorotate dehydrogenase B, catalytic subunit [Enhygromyxa salina]